MSKLEETNRQLREQLQLAMDDVGEKTSELETVSIESVNCRVVSIESASCHVLTIESVSCHVVSIESVSCHVVGIESVSCHVVSIELLLSLLMLMGVAACERRFCLCMVFSGKKTRRWKLLLLLVSKQKQSIS